MKYVGSKNRLSKQLAPIIQSYVNNGCNAYIEPFVGGANMIDKITHSNKYGYDSHKYLIALLKQAQKNISVFPEEITEQEYQYVKSHITDSIFEDWYVGLVGFCSFGGKWFGGYPRSFKNDGVTPRNMTNEIIRNLIKQAPNLVGINFTCCDFRNIPIDKLEGNVIYCDPPYKGTTKYATGTFPYDEYYDWCRKLSKDNTILCSEYWMPDDFEVVWEGRLTCALDKSSCSSKTEKLYLCHC